MSCVECIICADRVTADCILVSLMCGHIFHDHCLANWMRARLTCPQCRHVAANAGPQAPRRMYLQFTDDNSLLEEALLSKLEEKVRISEAIIHSLNDTITKLTSNNLQMSQRLKVRICPAAPLTIQSRNEFISKIKEIERQNVLRANPARMEARRRRVELQIETERRESHPLLTRVRIEAENKK